MAQMRDWQRNRNMWIRVLEKQTGQTLSNWNRQLKALAPRDERSMRSWLAMHKVTGYAQSLLVMEYFGYPDFVQATAEELIAKQYADRKQLRSIYDAVIDSASRCGEVIIQARKTYVSLVSPRRTFARVQATTRTRVDLGLRLAAVPAGRLRPSRIHATMPVQVSLSSPQEVDDDLHSLLQRAFDENC